MHTNQPSSTPREINSAHNNPVGPSPGFTLIELLIASALLLIVTLAAFNFAAHAQARLRELAEAEALDHRRSVVLDNLRFDFEQAGMHLLPPQVRITSQEPVFLTTSSHYQTTTLGRCRKLTDEPGIMTTSARGMYASGWLQFKPHSIGTGIVGFIGQDQSVIALQFVPNEASGSGDLHYYHKVGTTVSNPIIDSSHEVGDHYRLYLDGDRPRGPLTIKVYRIKQAQVPALISSFAIDEAQYPYRPMAELERAGAELYSMMMSGVANAVVHTGPALLPVDTAVGTARLPSVVNIKATAGVFESVSLLQGDINVDVVRTFDNADESFASLGAATLRINSPCNGSYRVGDVIALIDDTGHQQTTALFHVVAPEPVVQCGTQAILTLESATAESPAWGRLSSLPEDYNRIYLRGITQVVKLLPPVTYRLDRVAGTLLRQEGMRELVAARGATEFSVVERAQTGFTSYEMSCQLQREGFTTRAAAGSAAGYATVKLVASPRAMSQKYEYQKLGRPME
ncbi:MAG: prepilin-type N-terminal cleavage/methylation domain-containing protein [Pyrinomonadaceae bacterium]